MIDLFVPLKPLFLGILKICLQQQVQLRILSHIKTGTKTIFGHSQTKSLVDNISAQK